MHLAQAGRPGGKGVTVAVLDTGRRLRQPRPLPALAGLLASTASSAAGTSSTTTRTPTTTTATARTSPSTIAEGTGQRDRPHRPRLRREAHAGQGARPRRRGRLGADRRGHPLRRRPRRQGHQPLVRVPVGHHALADPEHPRRDPPRPAQGRRSSSAPPATPPPPPSPTRRAPATSSRSARPPSTAARPTTPTRAPTSTSSPPAAAPTTRSKATRAAAPPSPPGLDIFQMTFTHTNGFRRFGLPDGYIGTSMAAPHVSATAALVVASGILGPNPTPGRDRAPAGDDRARPRPARQGPALRRGPARRRRGDRPRPDGASRRST